MKSIKKLILLFVCSAFIFSISSCDSFFEPLPEETAENSQVEEPMPPTAKPENIVFTESNLQEPVQSVEPDNSSVLEEETTETPEVADPPLEETEDTSVEEEVDGEVESDTVFEDVEAETPEEDIVDTPAVEETEPETEIEIPTDEEVEEDTSVTDKPSVEDTDSGAEQEPEVEEEVEEKVEEETTHDQVEEEFPKENVDKPSEKVEEEPIEKPSNTENYPTSDGQYISEALVFTSGVHVLKDLIIICDSDDRAAIYAEGAGTVIIIESGVYYGGTNGSSAPAVYARDGATVIINGGSFYTGEGNATVYAKNYAYVEINDGSFMALAPWQNNYYVLNLADNTNSKILVKGGMFRKFDPSNNYSENPCVNFVAEGYRVVPVVKENGDIWYKVEILKK